MSKNIDKIKLKALLPTTQGTYNMILSSLKMMNSTIENQLIVLERIISNVNDENNMPELENSDLKVEFLTSIGDFKDLLKSFIENISSSISYVKNKRSSINLLTDELIKNSEIQVDEIFDNINDIIDTITKLLGTPTEVKDLYGDRFSKTYLIFEQYCKIVNNDYNYEYLKKEQDKVNNDLEMLKHTSISVIDSINVIDTCTVLIKALINNK